MARAKRAATAAPASATGTIPGLGQAGDVAAEWKPISWVRPWADNPRLNDSTVPDVAESMRRHGFGAPLICRSDGTLIAGHTRLKAALLLSLPVVPVRVMDHLTAEQAEELALADNRLGERSVWDPEGLAKILDRLGAQRSAIAGWNEQQRRAILKVLRKPTDEPPELEKAVVSKPGSYQLGRHTLVYGSSIGVEVEAEGLLFDPPFDVDYGQWSTPSGCVVIVCWRRCDSAYHWISERLRAGFGSHELVFTGGVRGQHNHTLPCTMHENVTVLRRKWWKDKLEALDREVLKASGAKVAKDGRHISWQEHSGGVVAAQSIGMSWAKPVLQMLIAMAYMPPDARVADPCAGSGSGLIAAERSGRTWLGWETQGQWVDLIRRRWTRECAASGVDPGPHALS